MGFVKYFFYKKKLENNITEVGRLIFMSQVFDLPFSYKNCILKCTFSRHCDRHLHYSV